MFVGNKNGYHNNKLSVSPWEQSRQQNSFDYSQRFIGHCNTHTDIKEATFLGHNGEYVGAGSDDGNAFIWDRKSGNLVKVLIADESIVNCVQWNPHSCLLATSGIEPVIRIWEPQLTSSIGATRSIDSMYKVCELNQSRMRLDPFEIMLMQLGLRVSHQPGAAPGNDDDNQDEPVDIEHHHPQCRQS